MPAVSKYFDLVMNKISHLDRIHWVGIAVVLVVVGIACMRGMNTRM